MAREFAQSNEKHRIIAVAHGAEMRASPVEHRDDACRHLTSGKWAAPLWFFCQVSYRPILVFSGLGASGRFF